MYSTLCHAVTKNSQKILDAERFVWKNPEPGYCEWKTSKYLEAEFEALGYSLTKAGNIPGFYTDIFTGRPGPTILIFGEMDSLICNEHPEADPETKAVHNCGHNAQCATLIGIAAALKEPHVLDELCGTIRLCAVPAEEGIQIQYRNKLRNEGTIRYFGGKVEFLYRGYFDDVDIAFMIHTTTGNNAMIRLGSVGNIRKTVKYKGVSAHAGGSPSEGINALYAATLGLQAINSLRETFKEEDLIRVHPIITRGGAAVNAIPSDVEIESYVRGLRFDAILRENKKINRALAGSAVSLGAGVEIADFSGYYPLRNDENMIDITKTAMEYVMGKDKVVFIESYGTGSTDMGDMSAIMPVIHPYMPGACGAGHGSDYNICDPQTACVENAKVQLIMLHLLLSDNAAKANMVIANKKVDFASKEEFFKFINSAEKTVDAVTYTDKGIEVNL